MMNRELRIEVRDSVLDPNLPPNSPKKAHWSEGADGRPRYKVWIYLVGDDLPYVSSVTYTLHPTFADPVQQVSRTPANPNCQLVIWTWGLFDVKATIVDKMSNVYEVMYSLSYDKQLAQSDIEYVREEETLPPSRQPRFKGSLR
jgi:hypothetical protein